MNKKMWLKRLQTLLERFPHHGVGDDIGAMDLTALCGVPQIRQLLEGEV